MNTSKKLFIKKDAEFDQKLELKIFMTFASLFIVPLGLFLLSHKYLKMHDYLCCSMAALAMILLLFRMFFYTKKLDKQTDMDEKYD